MTEITTETKILKLCFQILWTSIALGIGILIISFNPDAILILFSLIPFGMGFLGILNIIYIIKSWNDPMKTSVGNLRSHTIRPNSVSRQKSVYRTPPICPSCGADINTETVDWVGPLQAKCPYCGATVDADERKF
jgi:predicted RNA-binding Zn-ribbon protein involved in translation (DUF1610 family)